MNQERDRIFAEAAEIVPNGGGQRRRVSRLWKVKERRSRQSWRMRKQQRVITEAELESREPGI